MGAGVQGFDAAEVAAAADLSMWIQFTFLFLQSHNSPILLPTN